MIFIFLNLISNLNIQFFIKIQIKFPIVFVQIKSSKNLIKLKSLKFNLRNLIFNFKVHSNNFLIIIVGFNYLKKD